jgi:hypothetical protein
MLVILTPDVVPWSPPPLPPMPPSPRPPAPPSPPPPARNGDRRSAAHSTMHVVGVAAAWLSTRFLCDAFVPGRRVGAP